MKSSEPGWAQIVLGAVGAAASVDSRIVAVCDVKWEELHVTFPPDELAAVLRVRLADAVLLGKASRVSCRLFPRLVGGNAERRAELRRVMCNQHSQ